MCSRTTVVKSEQKGRAAALGVGLLFLLGLGFAPQVFAVQASGSVSINPSANTLVKDQVFTAIIRVNNTSTETGAEGTAGVPATYLAGGAVTVTLACTSSTCTTQLPGTLQFQPQGTNGCVTSNPGVDPVNGCVASGTNAVIINVASNIAIDPGASVDLATIQLKAVTPVLNPVNGQFFQRAASGDNDIQACSLANPALGCVTGGAQGSTSYLFPGLCGVKVDKQISCDGGVTWVDQGLETNNEDGANGCSTANPNPIMVRYQVQDSGDFGLSSCTLSDTNGTFGTPPSVPELTSGQTTDLLPGSSTPQCTTAVGNEPDTATVNCTCAGPSGPTPVSASDQATFACQEVCLKTDRNVNCGSGAVDNDLVTANEDGTNGCTGFTAFDSTPATPINWGYQANNCSTGPTGAPLHDCTLVDQDNLVSPNPIVVGTLLPGDTIPESATNNPVPCSTDLQTAEAPNGGKVTLTCCTVESGTIDQCPSEAQTVSVFDVSTVTCLTPQLNVTKTCVSTGASQPDTVTITAQNTGTANLVNCTPTDSIFLDDPTCPADVGTGTSVPVTPSPFNVAAGDSQDVTGTVGPLTADACNTASVTCTVEGTTDTVTGTADAVCPSQPPSQGCLERTPGFWGNHPFLITGTDPRSLNLLPLTVCGIELTNVDAGNGQSTTEAICSVGKDSKILGPQETQLIRQCTAAELNVAASLALGGNCESRFDFPHLGDLLTACCGEESVCTGTPVPGFTVNSCITELDSFNNTEPSTLNFPFNTGPADSSICRDAKNNGVVVSPTP